MTPNRQWYSFDLTDRNGNAIALITPGEILVDNRNSQWKWIPHLRYKTGLILLQDNGTPTDPNDDRVTFHKEWIDQNYSKQYHYAKAIWGDSYTGKSYTEYSRD